jgi:hypothetical protein
MPPLISDNSLGQLPGFTLDRSTLRWIDAGQLAFDIPQIAR